VTAGAAPGYDERPLDVARSHPPMQTIPPRPSPASRPRLAALAAAVLLAAAGCVSGDPLSPPPVAGLGTLEGRWDGEAWRGYGYAVLSADTLYLVGHRPDPKYFYDEVVQVQVPFRGAATYPLTVKEATLRQITGGDAGYFPGAVGELRVTHHDRAAARIQGTISLTAAEQSFRWRFEDGTFDAPVYARWEDVPRVRGH